MKILNILEITNKDYSGQPIANRYFAQRIEQYASNIDKTRVFYSYQLLKESLKILGLDLDKLVLNTTEDGKPFFEDETLNLFFSITHNKALGGLRNIRFTTRTWCVLSVLQISLSEDWRRRMNWIVLKIKGV